ncbi:MAG TPA: F0F1 ATP synthase subunit A [Blastocatellia bacterium]|jgi:F-type H+-transporting ATPase subunit a|nr:F0F1 ATP synthase subunit A [Blastocatellia bacterium]
MLAIILALLQHAPEAAEHVEKTAEEHEPAIVEWVNHTFGPAVLSVERAILPPIYGLFGATWHEPKPGHEIPAHVFFTLVLMVIVVAGILLLRGKLSVDRPSKGQQLLEVVVEQIRGLLDQVIGPYGRRYVPVVGGFAVFILIGNLMGLVPGLAPPTDNINVTGALGITSFLYYISMGFRQQGIKYLKHFTGGLTGALLPTLGILIFVVEILSNSVRPVTLSLRLFVNMFADHKIATVFLDLAPWLVPIFTIVLGVFVSFVQTFIFIMLSMVYLSETVPHEEHDHEEPGHGHEATAEAH